MKSQQVKTHVFEQLRSMDRCTMKRFRVALETELADRAFGEYSKIVVNALDERDRRAEEVTA